MEWLLRLGHVLGEPGVTVQRDHGKAGSHGVLHGQFSQQHQRRNDQEAPADAHHARQNAHRHALQGRHEWFEFRRVARVPGGRAEHHDGGQQHHHGKNRELHRAAHVLTERRTKHGAQHAGQPEPQEPPPVHQPFTGVGQQPEQADAAHNRQTLRDGELVRFTHQVNQHWDGQDAPAGTQQTQAQPDQGRADPRQDQGCSPDLTSRPS